MGDAHERLARSLAIDLGAYLKPGERLITIAASSEAFTDQRVKDAFLIAESNQKQLVEVARLLDAGALKAFVSAVVPLERQP